MTDDPPDVALPVGALPALQLLAPFGPNVYAVQIRHREGKQFMRVILKDGTFHDLNTHTGERLVKGDA